MHLIWTLYLMPVAFYLVFLGQNHQVGKPQVISGRADLMRFLAAISGLVILGGPRMLAHLHQRWSIDSIAVGGPEPWFVSRDFWVLVFCFYAVAVAFWAYCLWIARERTTLVHPVAVSQVEAALESLALDDHFPKGPDPAQGGGACRIVADPWLQSVEIRWSEGMLPWKAKAEADLQKELARVRVEPNRLWMVAVGLGLGMLGFLAFLNLGQAWLVLRQGA